MGDFVVGAVAGFNVGAAQKFEGGAVAAVVVVHILQAMDDDIDRPPDVGVVHDALLGFLPIIQDIGELFIVHDHQNVEVALVLWP